VIFGEGVISAIVLISFQSLLRSPPLSLSLAVKVAIFVGKSLHFSAGLFLILVGLSLIFPRKRSPFWPENLSLAGLSHFSSTKFSSFAGKSLPHQKRSSLAGKSLPFRRKIAFLLVEKQDYEFYGGGGGGQGSRMYRMLVGTPGFPIYLFLAVTRM
jgi:hypothetical protein